MKKNFSFIVKLVKTTVIQGYALYSIIALSIKVLVARLKRKKIAFILATPTHPNLGDQAIAYAQKKFLNKYLTGYLIIETKMLSSSILPKELKLLRTIINDEDLVFGHGGGNMGNQYPREERVRQLLIRSFPRNQIIIFPQTIHFTGLHDSKKALDDMERQYSQHPHLTIIAREKKSYNYIKEHFSMNQVLLTPDIVLSLRSVPSSSVRSGAMTCLRNDVEKNLTTEAAEMIVRTLSRRYSKVNTSDTISRKNVILTDKVRITELNKKWREFNEAEVVVTDRLHGMIFAAITNTPCVILSNYNHKIAGTYEWLRDLPYIRFCSDIELLDAALDLATQAENVPTPDFTEYWSKIVNEVTS